MICTHILHCLALIGTDDLKMLFEIDTFHLVTPLDPYEGDIYNEPMDEYAQSPTIENVYKITRCMEDYTNPTTDR